MNNPNSRSKILTTRYSYKRREPNKNTEHEVLVSDVGCGHKEENGLR